MKTIITIQHTQSIHHTNVVETVDHGNSIMIDYQFEKNIYSDSQFVKDYLEKQPISKEEVILVTDGGYCGYENVKQAAEKNIHLIHLVRQR